MCIRDRYKISLMKNAFYAQSGGVTSVINCSAYGLFNGFKKHFSNSNIFVGKNGIVGLIEDEIYDLSKTQKSLDLLLDSPGGMFGSCRYKLPDPESDSSFYEKIFKKFEDRNIGYFFYNGGNDSADTCLKIHQAAQILKFDLCAIAIPKTIDNDVGATESSIGFHTAVDVATQALDNLQSTAASHRRSMILEVMGRDAGHIALNAGIAGGADIILIPEINYSINGIINKLNSMKKNDIQHSLIVVAEAVKKEDGSKVVHKYMDGEQRLGGIGDYIAQELMKKTDVECRVTSLGHVQRGAPPTASDRILASAFGVYAVDLLNQKKFDRMVAWRDRRVVDVPIDEGIKTYKNVERKDSLVETALSLGIYLGDDI